MTFARNFGYYADALILPTPLPTALLLGTQSDKGLSSNGTRISQSADRRDEKPVVNSRNVKTKSNSNQYSKYSARPRINAGEKRADNSRQTAQIPYSEKIIVAKPDVFAPSVFRYLFVDSLRFGQTIEPLIKFAQLKSFDKRNCQNAMLTSL